jgi:hypothetical protein
MDLRPGDAVQHRIRPAHQAVGRNRSHALLHRIEHGSQLLTPVFDLGNALSQALRGLVERGLHGDQLVLVIEGDTRIQVSLGHAAGKAHNSIDARSHATRSPCGQDNRENQCGHAGQEYIGAEKTEGRTNREPQRLEGNHGDEDKLHRRDLNDQHQDKKSQQPGEDSSYQSLRSGPAHCGAPPA